MLGQPDDFETIGSFTEHIEFFTLEQPSNAVANERMIVSQDYTDATGHIQFSRGISTVSSVPCGTRRERLTDPPSAATRSSISTSPIPRRPVPGATAAGSTP